VPEVVLESVRAINRLALAQRTMRHALEALLRNGALVEGRVPPEWRERYLGESAALPRSNDGGTQSNVAQTVGSDGFCLLDALHDVGRLKGRRWPGEVAMLEQVWSWLFTRDGEVVGWRGTGCCGADPADGGRV
jgi:hypothetical protein